jgi:hypothetical protein
MKKSLLALACVIASLSAFAQGSVNFSNAGAGFSFAVKDQNGNNLAGAGFMAELLVGADANSVAPLSTPVTAAFLTGGGAGFFNGGVKTLPGFAAGTKPFFLVRAWDVSTGASYAAASVKGQMAAPVQFGVNLGDPSAQPPTTPATLIGGTSFNLVPEPSTIALAVLGIGALLLRRRK